MRPAVVCMMDVWIVFVWTEQRGQVTAGWLEPLMGRIAEGTEHVVMPQIDSINADTFAYESGGIDILAFSWTLGQKGLARRRSQFEPMESPIMAGGLFSIDRLVFYQLGTYDQGMRLFVAKITTNVACYSSLADEDFTC